MVARLLYARVWLLFPARLAGGTAGKSLNDLTMATDDEIESILSSDTFCAAPKISFASSIEKITRDVIEYSEAGVPYVITGFPLTEGEQSPFRQSREWIESVYTSRGASIPGFSSTPSLKYRSSRRSVVQCPRHRRRPQHHR